MNSLLLCCCLCGVTGAGKLQVEYIIDLQTGEIAARMESAAPFGSQMVTAFRLRPVPSQDPRYIILRGQGTVEFDRPRLFQRGRWLRFRRCRR